VTDRTERGQILAVVAVGMVVLIGIAALVVDLGFAWMARRQAQNAVDPGAIAAARFIDDVTGASIDPASALIAACFYAHQNGYFGGPSSTAECIPANDEHASTLTVNFPPDATAGQWAGAVGMVQVKITSQRDSFFGAIVGGPMTVSEQAVAARQRGNTNTHSLIALNPDDCNTGNVHGTATVKIYPAPGYTGDGGYVQVNSDCGMGDSGNDACGPGTGALKIDGTAHLQAPKINVHGSCQSNSAPVGALDEAAAQIGDPLAGLVPPPINPALDGATCGVSSQPTLASDTNRQRCGSSKMPWTFSPDSDCPGISATFKCVVLQPGVYYGGWEIGTKIHVRLNPGIYTIAGGGIEIKSAGELDSIQSVGGTPAPVMIFNTDNPTSTVCPKNNDSRCQADLALGTATSKLKIAGLLPDQPCPPATTTGGCPFGRMVIWHDAEGSQVDGDIHVEGGGTLFISGTIYAPTGLVDIEGHAGTNCGTGTETQKASVQIIAWEWRIGGTGDLCMPYDPSLLYKLTQQGLVH
jgi:Putative Flp pilus-assembly TadE/G-like